MLNYKYSICKLICVAAMFVCVLHADAQLYGRQKQDKSSAKGAQIVKNTYSNAIDSLISMYRNWQYRGTDVLANPYYASLMGSPTLYGATLHRMLGEIGLLQKSEMSMLPSSNKAFDVTDEVNHYLVLAYTQFPWLVHHEEVQQGTRDLEHEIRNSVNRDKTFSEEFMEVKPDDEPTHIIPEEDHFDVVVRKPNFWTFNTTFSMKFTQNYVSDNWYKGGESHNSLLASATIKANYNNQRKVTFDNTLEMKLGFQTSHNDDEHKYKTNSDLIRLTNKLGLRAIKHWSYTMTLQSWTQFYKGYKSNDPKVYSDFMSPFESLLSIGMDYNRSTKNNKFTVNASLSPIALKLKYVNRPSLVTSFGIDEGHHAKWDYGSNITINYTWNIIKNVSWRGRIYYFTDYSKSQIEWENTFKFTINKYLSSELFLYPRFDDSVRRKEGASYFQFNELLSLGLDLSF